MASLARYVQGDTRPKAVLCDPSYPIEVGDLLYRVAGTNLARPASGMSNQYTEVNNQIMFHNAFLGVALQKNLAQTGEALPLNPVTIRTPLNVIEVATQGIFEFPLSAAATFNGGELVGPANNTANTALQNQVVKMVTTIQQSIGRASPDANEIGQKTSQVADKAFSGMQTYVKVEILSEVFYGGEPVATSGSSSSGQ